MSDNVIIAYKNIGETPLECLERYRKERNIDKDIPMTYAGRLDPMAEGLMILLVGEECKNKDKYLGLNKTYEFKILVGFSTDTYDLLGLVTQSEDKISSSLMGSPDTEILSSDLAQELQKILDQFIGTFTQKYPSFSSKTILGKQLWELSKDDELPENLPEHDVDIYKLSFNSSKIIQIEDLKKEIVSRISLVNGDFRQEKIVEKWNQVFKDINQDCFEILSFGCECSSGTYIRQLVADISKKVGLPMVTYSINRTKIGSHKLLKL